MVPVTDDFRRKLAAVLCADVAGYTQLMRGDENATHVAYKACLNDVILPALEAHRGRLVKSTGDGFIAVFDSVVAGLVCALAIQEGTAKRVGDAGLRFRIGINVGDIIEEDDDVYGDGVNTASRLQARAAPGGVCVSALVREQVKGKLQIAFESLGRRRVKKDEMPFEAFAVHADPALLRPPWGPRMVSLARPIARRWRVIGLAAVTICAVALAAAGTDFVPMRRIADLVIGGKDFRLPLPDRPSLVVLPFKNIGERPEQEYFADGITEDIITDLSRLSGLFVIANNSSFAYKSRSRDVRKIGRELGVRYALDGSVRRSDDTLRIAVQLIDARSGGHVWATRFDRPIGDVFKIQDEITQKIVEALSVNIKERERTQTAGALTASVAAYDAYLRGWAAYRHNTYEDYGKAVEAFQSALVIDPDFAQAHAAMAATFLAMRKYAWTRSESLDSPTRIVLSAEQRGEELLNNAREHLRAALKNPTPLAYRSVAEILIFERRHEDALAEIRKAIALDPNDADNYAMLSAALVWAGNPEAAIEPIERATRLNPFHPPIYLCHYGSALFSLARYAEARDKLEGCRTGNPENLWPYIYLIAAYAYLGQHADAAAARERASELLYRLDRSSFTVKEVGNRMRYRYPADLLRLQVGLHKARVPNSLF